MENSLLFSETIDCTILSWSPDGLFLAHDSNYGCSSTITSVVPSSSKTQQRIPQYNPEIIIRDVKTDLGYFKAFSYFKPCQPSVTSSKSKISCLTWSSDSSYLAAGFYEEGIVYVFSLDTPSWKCKIDVGDEIEGIGLIDFCWSPRSRHVLTTASDYIQMTIWPISGAATYRTKLYVRDIVPIKNFKDFSEDGSKLAILQYDVGLLDIGGDGDNKSKDSSVDKNITIFNTSTWKPQIIFSINVKDAIGLKWCPNPEANVILFWDSPLFSNFYIYSATDGSLIKHISPDGLAPGIKAIEWSITGQLLVFLNHRNVVRFVNGLSFGTLLEETIDIDLPENYPDCVVYVEKTFEERGTDNKKETPVPKYKYFASKKVPDSFLTQDFIKVKTDVIRYSWDGKFLAIYLQSFPNVIWIWNLPSVKMCSVLVQRDAVSDFKWDTLEHRLCVSCANENIYFWTPVGCYLSKIPCDDDNFIAEHLDWNPNGSRFIVSSIEAMSCCTFKSLQPK